MATLGLTLVLLVAASLLVLYSHRALLFDQRAAANLVRAAQAFEAAESGLDWAVGQLARGAALDARCSPSTDAAARPLRQLLQQDPAQPVAVAACWHAGGTDWECRCPPDGAVLPLPAGEARPVFALSGGPAAADGSQPLSARGCVASGPCDSADALAELQTLAVPLPLLAQPPRSALLAQQAVWLGDATTVQHSDLEVAGPAVHAGGPVARAPGSRLFGPPGQPDSALVRGDDPLLRQGSLRLRLLGIAPQDLRRTPAVARVACAGVCDAAVLQAARAPDAPPVWWIEGGLQVQDAAPWGSAEAPRLLVVDGPLQVRGTWSGWGLVIAESIDWQTGGQTASWQGALVATGSVRLDGPVWLRHDAATLQRLATGLLSVKAPTRWHDFELR